MKLVLDTMGNAASWSALAADGVTASAEISITADHNEYQLIDDRTSLRFSVSSAAQSHRIRRTLATAQSLAAVPEVRFWIRADHAADGSDGAPFFLQLKLASVATPVDSAGNTWSRSIPVSQPGTWELVHVSIDDLPASIRGAVTDILFICSATAPAANFNLDSMVAVREELLTDVETALAAALHEKVTTPDNTKVPAVVHNPDGPGPAAPQVRLYLTEMRVDESRNTLVARRDFAGRTYRMQMPPVGYAFIYEIEAIAAETETRTRIFDFVLASFAPRNTLEVNAVPLPIEWQPRRPWRVLTALPERFRLRFRIRAWQSTGVTAAVAPPFADINLSMDAQDLRTN